MNETTETRAARQLLDHEAAAFAAAAASGGDATPNPQTTIEAAERVFEKLHLHLSKLVGREGYRTLLSRALVLATAQFPPLRAVRVRADGALEGLTGGVNDESGDGSNSDGAAAAAAAAALLASLVGLLVAFIGEDITVRILRTIWPDFHFDETTGAAEAVTDNSGGGGSGAPVREKDIS